VAKRAVGSHLAIRQASILVRASLVPELAVEGLDEGVVHELAGADEVELDAAAVRPGVQRCAREFGAVVDGR
jgi:hypothetical protein